MHHDSSELQADKGKRMDRVRKGVMSYGKRAGIKNGQGVSPNKRKKGGGVELEPPFQKRQRFPLNRGESQSQDE